MTSINTLLSVTRLTNRFYSRVTRYGTGGFLKARLETGKG